MAVAEAMVEVGVDLGAVEGAEVAATKSNGMGMGSDKLASYVGKIARRLVQRLLMAFGECDLSHIYGLNVTEASSITC